METLVLFFALVAATSCVPLLGSPIPKLDGRIVGGEDVSIEDYNYQASMQFFGTHRCGAVIVSPDVALTAAHCTVGLPEILLQIRAGSSIRNFFGIVVAVAEKFEHPNFNPDTVDYDIAVLRLSEGLQFSAEIGNVALPLPGQAAPVGALSVVTGWGAIHESGQPVDQLQAVRVPVVSLEECRAAYGEDTVTDRMICAGVPEGGRDACEGDSGGPLVLEGILIGLVSWGAGCARPGYPGVYSNVLDLVDFITETARL